MAGRREGGGGIRGRRQEGEELNEEDEEAVGFGKSGRG